jgi:protoporphyrinogen oxidase
MADDRPSVIILGAGLGGLSAGWVLATRGHRVTIVEKTAHAGGLAVTRERGPYAYDLGPHNIHTGHAYILLLFERRLSGLFEHVLTSRILKRGRFVQYPLKGAQVITSLPIWKVLPAITSFMAARARMFFGDPREDGSFGCWIRNRFGAILYREYFQEYPRKVWNLPPDEIDRYVAEKRVPVLGMTEMIRAVLLGKPPRVAHPEFPAENYYLPRGIGALPEFFRAEFERLGGAIVYRAAPTGIQAAGAELSVTVRQESGSLESHRCDYLLSTIPLNEFVPLFRDIPGPVRDAAARLRYLSMVLLYLEVGRRNALPAHMVYFPDGDTPFSRVSDFAAFSGAMAPSGKSLLCLELPCTEGDEHWTAPIGVITRMGIEALRARGLLTESDVEGAFLERITHSYPQFRRGFKADVDACLEFATGWPNVLTYGRQGGFAYVNTDTVVHMGFQAAGAVLMARSLGYTCMEWYSARVRP